MNILIKSSKLQLSRWEIDKISRSINSCRYVHPITMSTQITTKNEQTQADIRNIYSKTLALWPQFSSTSFKRVFLEFRKWNAKIANKCRSRSMYPSYTLSFMPNSCRKLQYDFRRPFSLFKSMPSLLDGEFSSISFLLKYHDGPSFLASSRLPRVLPLGLLSTTPWCDESLGTIAM